MNANKKPAKVYLVQQYLGELVPLVFATQEHAEAWIQSGECYQDTVLVATPGRTIGGELVPTKPTQSHIEWCAIEAALQQEETEAMRELLASLECEYCGAIGHAVCDCSKETNCGFFGGVTKSGNACLNTVSLRAGVRCYLHNNN